MNIFKFRLLPNGPCLYPELTMDDESFLYGPEVFSTFPRLGLRICVPPDLFMVVVLAEGKRIVLDEGYQFRPDIPLGRYQAYFIAKRQGNMPLTIETLCADSIRIKVEATAVWEVSHPKIIARVKKPLQQFKDLAEAVVSEVIRSYRYDEIVGTVPNTTPNLQNIVQKIWEQIIPLQYRCGLSTISLKIRSIHGDATLVDQAHDYLRAELNQKVVGIQGETQKSEETYTALAASIRQKSLALEDARNNLAKEPQRRQERIMKAMQEIGQMITTQANIDASSVPGFQQYYFKMDPAYGKAMEAAITTLRDLACCSTLPTEIQQLTGPLEHVEEVPSRSNGHKGIQSLPSVPAKPPKDHARRKITNEPQRLIS